MDWNELSSLPPRDWTCGYCGKEVGGDLGYYSGDLQFIDDPVCGTRCFSRNDFIYICPRCGNPTSFLTRPYGIPQVPLPSYGKKIDNLPELIGDLYREVRSCLKCGSYTAAVLIMRKMLMHIAVEKGAEPNKNFAYYVKYLDDEKWIPQSGSAWVDEIRVAANEATHEIIVFEEDDAKRLFDFTEMLLKIVYEFPMKLEEHGSAHGGTR